MSAAASTGPDWLADWQLKGTRTELGLARYDALAPLSIDDMLGHWAGSELRSGHPFDGILQGLGWYGKAFRTGEDVDPLLFHASNGRIRPLDPARLPVKLALGFPRLGRAAIAQTVFGLVQPLFTARGPAARLREIRHRGAHSAAMIYDARPIIDHFRRIDAHRVLGLMDMRWTGTPYFFLLTKDPSPPRRI